MNTVPVKYLMIMEMHFPRQAIWGRNLATFGNTVVKQSTKEMLMSDW